MTEKSVTSVSGKSFLIIRVTGRFIPKQAWYSVIMDSFVAGFKPRRGGGRTLSFETAADALAGTRLEDPVIDEVVVELDVDVYAVVDAVAEAVADAVVEAVAVAVLASARVHGITLNAVGFPDPILSGGWIYPSGVKDKEMALDAKVKKTPRSSTSTMKSLH